MCRAHDLATQAQGHSSGLWVFTLEFRVRSISPEPFERFSLNFTQIFLSVSWCANPLLSAMQTQSQGHTSRSWDSVAGDLAVLQTAVLY